MRRIFLLVSCLIFLGLPSFVLADTIVSAPILSDTTWSPAGGVYVIDSSFSILAGVTLTIEPGTIVKARITSMLGLGISGRLVAHGTSELPIHFTSWNDDSIGGDTNNDGPSVGTPGGWQGLYFKPGSEGDFDYVNISYAGYGGPYAYNYGHLVGIENDGGIINIQHSNIYDIYSNLFDWVIGNYRGGNAVYNKSGTLSVSDSIIDNSANGINIESGIATISGTVIKNNDGYSAGYGIYASGSEPLTLLNNTFSGNRRTANINASKDFTHGGNISNDISERGFQMSGIINQDTTWHSEDLPILISGSITVPSGKTLTIEPGTIIKLGDIYGNGSFDIYGDLIAEGTENSPIYFTSKKDDSVGGDTNGDDNLTTPAIRNWFGMIFNPESIIKFNYVVVKYSGYNANGEYLPGVGAAIYNRGGNFLVDNSFIGHNYGAGIFQDVGTTTINHSELTDNHWGFWSRGGSVTISQSSLHNNSDQAVYNQSGVELWWYPTKPMQVIDARNNWWGSADGPHDISTTTPTGAGDCVSENVLYVPFLTEPPSENQTIDPVIIIPGIMGSAYKNGELVIDPILHTYDDLIATLIANGYEEGKDLFTFPYEWRDSNVLTANLLKDKINEVKSICGCSKVDLVAHSMGGLAAREYIQSGQYQNDVDQIIFLGTPHKGSPKAYLQWEAGEFPPSIREFLIQQIFTSESRRNGYADIFDYIHARPILSVQELLPIFDYLRDKDTGILRIYPNDYPRNIFLEYLNNDISDLLNSGVRITNIVGNAGNNTIKNIVVVPSSDPEKWTHGEMDGLDLGTGDDTVTTYGTALDPLIQNEEWNEVSHNNLPKETSARIFNLLTGNIANRVIFLTLIERIFSIQLQSPIDVVIIAPDGKKMGKNFETGEEYNEIPLAFYSGYQTDDEYITIPNPLDGEYKFEIQGTGDGGKYGVLMSYISDNFATTTEIAGLTQRNQITNLSINIDNENPENLESKKEVTEESLIADINKAYDLGWFKNQKVRDNLIWQINKIFRSEEISREYILKSWVTTLEMLLEDGKINQEAYNIMREDVNWLILNN